MEFKGGEIGMEPRCEGSRAFSEDNPALFAVGGYHAGSVAGGVESLALGDPALLMNEDAYE